VLLGIVSPHLEIRSAMETHANRKAMHTKILKARAIEPALASRLSCADLPSLLAQFTGPVYRPSLPAHLAQFTGASQAHPTPSLINLLRFQDAPVAMPSVAWRIWTIEVS